jgi:serine/threonine protein kinase
MIGTTVSHYKILERIGSGGMGEVYKAQDLKLDRIVALKFLPPEFARDADAKRRFIHEAKAASALDHNNICNIHEIDQTEDGRLFIIMAYYEGESLEKKIEGERLLSLNDILDIAIQVARGLSRAHESGITHRDLKPANIMVTNRGEAKIVDFGLAKLGTLSRLTKEGTTLGTIAYMSPEQTRGEAVDVRTDIWSLGVILYEMICGQAPFKGKYDQAVIYGICNEDPQPLTGIRTNVPAELERIVNRALAKDPTDRYQHVDDLLSELNRLRKETNSGINIIKKDSPKRRLRPVLATGLFLTLLILIVAGYFLLKPPASLGSEWENSIAVLPFENISNDPEQEYFCDGMTEQIITNLSHIQRLKVTARTSIMKYKTTKKSIREIAAELRVSHILEGSVRKSGNKIRITAQLIEAEGGYHLWAKDYDRELKDIFAVQDDVSSSIARSLLDKLSEKEVTDIKSVQPANNEAYEHYLRADYLHKKFSHTFQSEDFKTAEFLFKKSIDNDPNFALSYAELANLYNTYYNYSTKSAEERKKYLDLQEQYIEKAEHLAPNSVEVSFIKAFVLDAKGERDKSFYCFKRVLDMNPSHSGANFQVGVFLRNCGLLDHCFKYLDRAIELDPLDSWGYGGRAWAYFKLGKYDEAAEDFNRTFQIEPDDKLIQLFNIEFLIISNKPDTAENYMRRFEQIYPDERQVNVFKAWLLALRGEKESALKMFEEAVGGIRDKITLYQLLELKNEALLLMEESQKDLVGRRRSFYLQYKSMPFYKSLQDDERFINILVKEKEIYERILRKYVGIE